MKSDTRNTTAKTTPSKTVQPQILKNTPLRDIIRLAPACACNACSNGCKWGSGAFVGDEPKKAAAWLGLSEEAFREKYLEEKEMFHTTLWHPKLIKANDKAHLPYGRCIFYDDKKGCGIHPVKPLQCKVSMGCKKEGEQLNQWFIINHAVNPDDPESIRQYAQAIAAGMQPLPDANVEHLVPDKEKREKMLRHQVI